MSWPRIRRRSQEAGGARATCFLNISNMVTRYSNRVTNKTHLFSSVTSHRSPFKTAFEAELVYISFY